MEPEVGTCVDDDSDGGDGSERARPADRPDGERLDLEAGYNLLTLPGTMKTKPSLVNKLNRLICTGRFIAGDAATSDFAKEDAATAVRFKQDAVDLLLDLASSVADIRTELVGMPAVKLTSTWDFNSEGEPIGRSMIDVVDVPGIRRIVRFLIKARRRLDAIHGTDTNAAQNHSEIPRPKGNGSYSSADDKVFDLIGEDEFRSHTNAELFKRYRSRANRLLERPLTDEGFRGICKRIRKHHDLPSSAAVRKPVKASKRNRSRTVRQTILNPLES